MNTNIIMLDKLIVDTCKDHGWSVWENPDDLSVELETTSPAGEDFFFAVSSYVDIISEVWDYSREFDPEEHVTMWINAKQAGVAGVPSVAELVQDADEIAEMLKDLADALARIEDKVQYSLPLF